MKKFFIQLLLLGVALLLVIALIEYRYSSYKTSLDVVMDKLENTKDTTETILIGNSHMGSMGDSCLAKTTNMAFPDVDAFQMMSISTYGILHCPNLKNIIIALDAHVLGISHESDLTGLQLYKYTQQLQDKSIGNRIMASSNYFRSGQDFKYLVNKNVVNTVNFIPLDYKEKNNYECVRKAFEHGKSKYLRKTESKNLNYFMELIKTCEKNNIKLIFITFPKCKCYTDQLMSFPNIQASFKRLTDTLHQLNSNYYNLMYDPTFNDDDFIDYNHLNQEGVDKMSLFFKQYLTQGK